MEHLDFEPVIGPRALDYLIIQQGRISSLAKGPEAWRAAYKRQLTETLVAIEAFLPEPLTSVLDIGGGMGGFDALLAKRSPGLAVTILDGMNCGAEVVDRDRPYSNARVAERFLRDNGVGDVWFFDPEKLPTRPEPFDLILSLQSWCFHYPPQVYMDFALKCSRPGTVWILDVRIMTRFWASDLFSQERLEPIGEAPGFTEKYTRMAFRVV